MIKTAVIVSTGDELTTGKVVDTNSTFVADRLFAAGIKVVAVLKVGDDPERLLWAFGQASGLGELIIGTGGLGPTADDLTTFLGRRTTSNRRFSPKVRLSYLIRLAPRPVFASI